MTRSIRPILGKHVRLFQRSSFPRIVLALVAGSVLSPVSWATEDLPEVEVEELAVLEEVVIYPSEEGIQQEEDTGEVVYVMTLSQWLEDNGGYAAVELMLAEEAKEVAKQVLADNPDQQAKLHAATDRALDKCEGTSIGTVSSYGSDDMDFLNADISVGFKIPFSVFGGLDWDNGEVSVGSHGYGVTTSTSVLWGGPEAIANCVQREIDDAVGILTEEVEKLMSGDYSLVKDALLAAAVDYVIDEVKDNHPQIGELLDTLERVCTTGGADCF